MEKSSNWYAVYTRPRWEKKVAKNLEEAGFICYCPLKKTRRRWSDRFKIVYEPLFNGYVFVIADDTIKWNIIKITGVINFVYWLGKPAIVREIEIETIKKFMNEFEAINVYKEKCAVNDTVVVTQGVFMDYKGIVLEVMGSKARVRLQSMGVVLEASIENKSIALIKRAQQ